jgi:hypothetical protein
MDQRSHLSTAIAAIAIDSDITKPYLGPISSVATRRTADWITPTEARTMKSRQTFSSWRSAAVAVATLGALAGACTTASAEPIDLETLGLSIQANIQAGSSFEAVVPNDPATSVEVISAPPGVTANISETPDGTSIRLSISVDADTPRGLYNLGLRAERDGESFELGWPFEVVEAVTLPSSSPEALRDEVLVAIAGKDSDALRSLWPASSWDAFGADILDDFVPAPDTGECQRSSDVLSECFVFELDVPRVLELTMELGGDGAWTVTGVSFESTN